MAFACKPVVKRAGSLLESLSILRITPTNEDLKTAWIRTAWQSTSSWTAELPGRQLEVLFKPIRQLLAGNAASCQSQHQSLLIIDVGDQLAAIQQDEDLHRCVRGPFVAIEEWVIHRQREAEGGPSREAMREDPYPRSWPWVVRAPIRARQDPGCRRRRLTVQ